MNNFEEIKIQGLEDIEGVNEEEEEKQIRTLNTEEEEEKTRQLEIKLNKKDSGDSDKNIDYASFAKASEMELEEKEKLIKVLDDLNEELNEHENIHRDVVRSPHTGENLVRQANPCAVGWHETAYLCHDGDEGRLPQQC